MYIQHPTSARRKENREKKKRRKEEKRTTRDDGVQDEKKQEDTPFRCSWRTRATRWCRLLSSSFQLSIHHDLSKKGGCGFTRRPVRRTPRPTLCSRTCHEKNRQTSKKWRPTDRPPKSTVQERHEALTSLARMINNGRITWRRDAETRPSRHTFASSSSSVHVCT